jgi:hexosaminidase
LRPALLPVPAHVEWRTGRVAIVRGWRLDVAGARDPRLLAYADRVQRRLEGRTGLTFAGTTDATTAAFVVKAQSAGAPIPTLGEDESYVLEIDDRGGRLEAATSVGAMRGLETLLQLVSADKDGYFLPAVHIEDRPRFPWRGLLIDVARHYLPVEVLKRNLDGMAAVKMNVLHWHLTEDQGFRIESRRYPRLHEMGSDGLYYTQDEARALIAYARDRGIRVVPELDVPGHATSWLVGHPELASAPGPYSIERRWGIFEPTLDPTRKETYRFLDHLFGEMAKLFPDPYFHIGGDEVKATQWKANPKIQAYMAKHGLADAHALQAHFNRHVNDILRKHGKRMVGWNEILHPDLPKDVVVQSWQGQTPLIDAARQGYTGILSQGYYLDLLHTASEHYLVDPLPAGGPLDDTEAARVLGGEACMWSEYVGIETVDGRIWPRLAAVAERLWSPRDVRDVAGLYPRLDVLSAQIEELGLTHERNHDVLLRRLAGTEDIVSLRELVDVLEPRISHLRRQQPRATQAMPLTRLAHVAHADSRGARRLADDVDALLLDAPRFAARRPELTATFARWKELRQPLAALAATSPIAHDAESLGQDLADAAAIGEQALQYLGAGTPATAAWLDGALATLSRAARPRSECELAVVPTLRELVLAASEPTPPPGAPAAEWRQELARRARALGQTPKD